MSDKKPIPIDASDEDLEELDDILDQFAAQPPAPARPSAEPAKPNPPLDNITDTLSDDFARELAKGMESLMRELGVPGEPQNDGSKDEEEKQRLFKAAWEAMLIEQMGEDTDESLKKAGIYDKGSEQEEGTSDFHKSIRQAMDKFKESEAALKTDPDSLSDDALAQMLAQLGTGEGGEGELQGFLEGMMTQLMSKNILYDPLKELRDKFPPYLESPPAGVSSEDIARYKAQQDLVIQIIATFDDPEYREAPDAEGHEKSTEKIVQLMGELQALGSPPPEIMGPLPPGLGADGLPDGCSLM